MSKKNSVDLSTKPKSISNYIALNLEKLGKKNVTVKDIFEFINDAKKHCNVSTAYMTKLIETMKQQGDNKGKILRYLADVMLKGADLGIIRANSNCLINIYSKNELIIKLACI